MRNLFILIVTLFVCSTAFPQQKDSLLFKRSSLYTFIITSEKDSIELSQRIVNSNVLTGSSGYDSESDIPRISIMIEEFKNIPLPVQYNDHNLECRVIRYEDYPVTKKDIDANGGNKGKGKRAFGKFLKEASNIAVGTSFDTDQKTTSEMRNELRAIYNKYFNTKGVGAQLIGKWYGYNNGKYDETFTLMKERGLQNASASTKQQAINSARRESNIQEQGEELVGNTFVMGIHLKYQDKEQIMADIQSGLDAAAGVASAFGVSTDMSVIASQALGAMGSLAMGSGYYVTAVSHLYQLEWNEEKEYDFYANYWDKSIDELIASGICTLKYIGSDKASTGIRAGRFSKQSKNSLVRRATARAIDEVIAKLQKEYDVFKTKTTIKEVDKKEGVLYAEIGMKEGISAGDTYIVLQPIFNEETMEVIGYDEVGKVKAVKNQIWDNRFDAEIERTEDQENGEKVGEALTKTAFKGKVKEEWVGCVLKLDKKK